MNIYVYQLAPLKIDALTSKSSSLYDAVFSLQNYDNINIGQIDKKQTHIVILK